MRAQARCRVVVTGAAGFVGSHLVDTLLRQLHQVVGVDDFSTGRRQNLSGAMLQEAFTLVEGDIRDAAALRQACEGGDVVVHLAAATNVTESVRNPEKYHDINVNGTEQVLAAAVQAQVSRVVFASSAAVYGTPDTIPIPETASTHPLSPYGQSKVEGERCCQAIAADHGIAIPQLRLFNIYGPRQPITSAAGVVPVFLDRARRGVPLVIFGDGNQTRDFIYIDDAVEAFLCAITRETVPSVPINVGVGIPVSIQELAETVQDLIPSCVHEVDYQPMRPGDIYHSVADTARMREVLGFTAQISLREGLARTYQEGPTGT